MLSMIERDLTADAMSCVVTDNGSEALLLVRESWPCSGTATSSQTAPPRQSLPN
jgi:hypothetical protein